MGITSGTEHMLTLRFGAAHGSDRGCEEDGKEAGGRAGVAVSRAAPDLGAWCGLSCVESRGISASLTSQLSRKAEETEESCPLMELLGEPFGAAEEEDEEEPPFVVSGVGGSALAQVPGGSPAGGGGPTGPGVLRSPFSL